MSTQTINPIDNKELYSQYSWYKDVYLPTIQETCDGFFLPGLSFSLLSLSKNINSLMGKDFYFVTKIRIDKQYDMFIRCSESAVSLILDKALGKSNKVFNLNKLTDLEAKIITSFNDYMYNMTSKLLSPPPAGELRRTNFDIIHLTFIIKDDKTNACGKFIMSLPDALLKPETITSTGEKFDNSTFATSTRDVKIKIGSTRFSLYDLKNLDVEDTVVFDNSNTKTMTLCIDDYEKEINLNPNLGLITPLENNGGNNMSVQNLWDSIEVEMNAEFDSVRITLGELKNIEEGNVVDLMPIYDNQVTLRVEDKTIARGELVIINDRYGVKITEVIADKADNVYSNSELPIDDNEFESQSPVTNEIPQETGEAPAHGEAEEFDYSDFELEDEDI